MNAATLRDHLAMVDVAIRETEAKMAQLLIRRQAIVRRATTCARCGTALTGDIRKRYCGAVCRSRQTSVNYYYARKAARAGRG